MLWCGTYGWVGVGCAAGCSACPRLLHLYLSPKSKASSPKSTSIACCCRALSHTHAPPLSPSKTAPQAPTQCFLSPFPLPLLSPPSSLPPSAPRPHHELHVRLVGLLHDVVHEHPGDLQVVVRAQPRAGVDGLLGV